MALTLHELATNAAKYGALSAATGRIDLKWSRDQDGPLTIHWAETGGPAVLTPTRRGFGGRIMKQMIGQLKGEARFEWRPEGLVCEISLQA
jgi:two-component sensor histidine kinase